MQFYGRLAAVLAEARELRGMSQQEVAQATGHATSTISRWEAAKAKPDAYDLHVIAKVLRLPPELLVDPPEQPVSPVRLALEDGAAARRDRPAPTLRGPAHRASMYLWRPRLNPIGKQK